MFQNFIPQFTFMRRGSSEETFPVMLKSQPEAGAIVTGEQELVALKLRSGFRIVADTAVAVYATGGRFRKGVYDPKEFRGFVGVCVLTPASHKQADTHLQMCYVSRPQCKLVPGVLRGAGFVFAALPATLVEDLDFVAWEARC